MHAAVSGESQNYAIDIMTTKAPIPGKKNIYLTDTLANYVLNFLEKSFVSRRPMSVKFNFGGIMSCHRNDYFYVKSEHTFVCLCIQEACFLCYAI